MAYSCVVPSGFASRKPSISALQNRIFTSDFCSPLRISVVPRRTRRHMIKVSFLAATSSKSVVMNDLDADDFRHPLDKQNTLLLRAIPGLNELGKALLAPVAEQVMVLENIGTSVLVSENQELVVVVDVIPLVVDV